jgi:GDP-L-fucose synthase
MVGSAVVRKLRSEGYHNLILKPHNIVDLSSQVETKWFLKDYKPDYIFICSAKVGGIHANNSYPVDFLYENMMIEFNIIKYAYEIGVKKLIMLGSSCIYPKNCKQPIREEYLLSNYLEATNEGYALAKISGIKLCQAYNKQYGTNFISVMPCSIFGVGDNFHPQNSHLIPAIMQRMYNAKINGDKEVEIWGTGKPKREFLYVDDLADGLLFLMQNYNESDIINIGTGVDYSISNIANQIKNIVGFKGELKFDTSKPDGTMKKLLDVSKINSLGWSHKIELKGGLKFLYEWFKNNYSNGVIKNV